MDIHTKEFFFNHNLSIEGSTFDYHDKYCNYLSNEKKLKMDFHSKFSYDSAYNTATTYEHMKRFSQWMYEENFHNI